MKFLTLQARRVPRTECGILADGHCKRNGEQVRLWGERGWGEGIRGGERASCYIHSLVSRDPVYFV